jgi:hypothetical protein
MSKKQKKFLKRGLKNLINVLIVFLLAFYVFQLNNTIKDSYLINSYQKKLEKLQEEEKLLKIDSFKDQRLKNIEEIALKLGFESGKKLD